MIELIFATNNLHKVKEIQAAIGNDINIITLVQAGITIDIPEPYDTLIENASEKSGTIFKLTRKSCFSEDTGLEVDALNGEPGVKSARYTDNDPLFNSNVEKLLIKMKKVKKRTARFRTIISLRIQEKEFFFEGVCEGIIAEKALGTNGFGYDPVFIPAGSDRTFADMTMDEKSVFSHRKKAGDKLVVFLQHMITANNVAGTKTG